MVSAHVSRQCFCFKIFLIFLRPVFLPSLLAGGGILFHFVYDRQFRQSSSGKKARRKRRRRRRRGEGRKEISFRRHVFIARRAFFIPECLMSKARDYCLIRTTDNSLTKFTFLQADTKRHINVMGWMYKGSEVLRPSLCLVVESEINIREFFLFSFVLFCNTPILFSDVLLLFSCTTAIASTILPLPAFFLFPSCLPCCFLDVVVMFEPHETGGWERSLPVAAKYVHPPPPPSRRLWQKQIVYATTLLIVPTFGGEKWKRLRGERERETEKRKRKESWRHVHTRRGSLEPRTRFGVFEIIFYYRKETAKNVCSHAC